MPTVHLFWNRHARLVKLSSKVKAGVISALSKSSISPNSSQNQALITDEKNEPKRPSPTYVGNSSVREISHDEILVTRGFTVSNTYTNTSDSDRYDLPRDARFKDLEAQKPLPYPPYAHGRHF